MAEAVLSSFISSLINKLALMKEIQLSTRQMCKAAIITVCSIPLTLTYFYEIRKGQVAVQCYLFIIIEYQPFSPQYFRLSTDQKLTDQWGDKTNHGYAGNL